jgi:hypothetical protein
MTLLEELKQRARHLKAETFAFTLRVTEHRGMQSFSSRNRRLCIQPD